MQVPRTAVAFDNALLDAPCLLKAGNRAADLHLVHRRSFADLRGREAWKSPELKPEAFNALVKMPDLRSLDVYLDALVEYHALRECAPAAT